MAWCIGAEGKVAWWKGGARRCSSCWEHRLGHEGARHALEGQLDVGGHGLVDPLAKLGDRRAHRLVVPVHQLLQPLFTHLLAQRICAARASLRLSLPAAEGGDERVQALDGGVELPLLGDLGEQRLYRLHERRAAFLVGDGSSVSRDAAPILKGEKHGTRRALLRGYTSTGESLRGQYW